MRGGRDSLPGMDHSPHTHEPAEPRAYAWLLPGRLAVSERPGRGGRSHRRQLRVAETEWWCAHGVTAIVSGMRTRHGLLDYALADITVRWHPLTDAGAPEQLDSLVAACVGLLEHGDGGVLAHCDRANEWLAGVDAALRLALGLSTTPHEALAAAAADGLPVGSLAASLVGAAPVGAPP